MKKNHQFKLKLSQWILLSLGLALLITGIFLGNPMDIYRKAIFICMECIGIG